MQRLLPCDSRLQRLERGRERCLEGIADDLEHDSSVCFDGFSQCGVVDLQRGSYLLRPSFPQGRGADDVGEQQGNGTIR